MSTIIRLALGVASAVCRARASASRPATQKATLSVSARTPSDTELARFVSPLPDGRGLPPGSGSVAQGKTSTTRSALRATARICKAGSAIA